MESGWGDAVARILSCVSDTLMSGVFSSLELLPLLRASAPARVVMVASAGQHPLQFDDLQLERG